MRRSGRPAIGHNCTFDIAYVLAACVEPRLPQTWPEYKRLVGEWFRCGGDSVPAWGFTLCS